MHTEATNQKEQVDKGLCPSVVSSRMLAILSTVKGNSQTGLLSKNIY